MGAVFLLSVEMRFPFLAPHSLVSLHFFCLKDAMTEFTTSGFFVLRTPMLSIQEFLGLAEGLAFAQALGNNGDLKSSAAADRKLLRFRLTKLLERPEIREALWLASPEFFDALSLWRKDPESAKGQKLERALYRYVARMTCRPTPFGLFAGCTLGKIGNETRLQIGPSAEYWRRSRLDMEYLFNLVEKIGSEPSLQRRLHFRPNTSLYLAAGRYHHAQSYLSNEVRCYRLIATEPTPYLAATLERASHSATLVELAAALVKDDPEVSLEDAEDYIRQLIQSQVLVSDLGPAITGPEPVEDMIAQLERAQESTVSAGLTSIANGLHKLDECGLGNDLAGYRQIVSAVSQLPAEFKPDHLIQVDMMKKPANVTLDQRLVRDILHGVEVLHSLGRSAQVDPFKEFKEDFRERYQDQEIPLVLALDDEVGIGFERRDQPASAPEPLLEGIDFSATDEEPTFKARNREFILMRKLQELAQEKKTVLDLDAKLLESLQVKNPSPLPGAFAVMLQIISSSGPKQDRFSFYLHGLNGPSGALLLGRFCPADDELTSCVREHLRAEEAQETGRNAIYAEIVHLPEGRIGNVLCRPILRDYEIPFLATSRAPLDHQIPVTDLMISVQGDRIVLRSARLGREVVPRLTSAHGYAHARNLKLYKFLCLLQTHGVSGGLSWSWGILEEAAFLPRVVLGEIVLAPARWRIDKEKIEQLSREEDIERLRKIEEWRTLNGIPRFVLLAESDNQLLIDFENVLSVETLIEYIKNRKSAELVETLALPESLCAHGPEGEFTHEIVVPFVRTKAPTAGKHARSTAKAASATSERDFLPGSEWLFAKIYASPSHADRILLEHIKPLVGKALASGAADRWFFIRYGDPNWHLRLRFHGDPATLSSRVLPELAERLELLRRQGKIWRMQLDTYERELERYGGQAGMRIAESLFQYDSELVLELLSVISSQLGGNVRWRLGFASVDCLLGGLGFDLSARRQLVNNLGKAQEKNFQVQQSYKKQLSEKFRKERQVLEDLLATSSDLPASAKPALACFTQQVEKIRLQLEFARQAGELARPIDELAASYVHMHLNRLFRSAANAQEMVLYDFLARVYDSKLAKEKPAK